jgi:fatty-acid desaturase
MPAEAAPKAAPSSAEFDSTPVATVSLQEKIDKPVKRQFILSYAVSFASVHLIALLVFWPWLFSWTGVLAFLVGFKVSQFGIPICYHRLLTHRSFRTPKWLERTWVVCALCQMQDTPAKWVAWHRMHHQHSDDKKDPHSPLVSFFWSHVGWLLFRTPGTHDISAYNKYARDILDDPFYMYLEKHRSAWIGIFVAHMAIVFAGGAAFGWYTSETAAGALQLGLSWLVWGVAFRIVYVWHITWSVNSLSHVFGYRNYDTTDVSRNNWFVAVITGGEGWHNNHHHDQRSASVKHRWWEFDPNYSTIRLFKWLGLVTDVVLPKPNAAPEKRLPR